MSIPQPQVKPPKPATTIVNLGGQNYRIRRLSPEVGSFIVTRILIAGADIIGQGAAAGTLVATFTVFLKGLNFADFQFIQSRCLAVVDRMEQLPGIQTEQPIPILNQDGSWATGEVAADLSLVLSLTVQSLLFNLSDFFDLSGLSSIMSGSRPPEVTKL